MTLFRILATIALLSFTASAFGTTVSGEIVSQNVSKKSVISQSSKKPVQKIVVRKYARTVSYTSPAGKETITFIVNTKNGVIIAATAIPKATNKISKSLQSSFSKKLSKGVVGKKIKNLSIDAIGGASLTTAAFREFTRKII